MKTLLIAASIAALATPAFGQTQTAPAQTLPARTPVPGETPQVPALPTTAMPVDPSAAVAPTPQDPKALIAREFPSYDKDGNGSLSKAEFAAWIGALKAKTDAKPETPAQLAKYTDGAFATADKDKSKTITLAELQNYLTAGA